MGELTLSNLRGQLVEVRQSISEIVTNINPVRQVYVEAKIKHKRALAAAKLKYKALAQDKEDKSPTMINARAEIDPDVIALEDAMIMAEGNLLAIETLLSAREEECKALKKAMSSLEAELRTFGA